MPTLKDELKTLREEFGKRMTDVEKVIEDQLGTQPNERDDEGKGSAPGARDRSSPDTGKRHSWKTARARSWSVSTKALRPGANARQPDGSPPAGVHV